MIFFLAATVPIVTLPLGVRMTAASEVTVAREAPPVEPGRTLRIVAFGTSLTERGGWTGPLQTTLAQCLNRPVEVIVIARSGMTSAWAVDNLDRVVAAQPDVVFIEFYANDAALYHSVSLRQSRANMQTILERLDRIRPKPRLVMMAMNPVSGLRGMLRPWIEDYIEAHRDVMMEHGGIFLDHRPAWLARSPADLSRLIPDGLHPLPQAAIEVVVPSLTRLIAGRSCAE